jgi:hypothetical protein
MEKLQSHFLEVKQEKLASWKHLKVLLAVSPLESIAI